MVTVDLHAPFVSRLAPRSRQDSEVVPVRPLPILVDIARRNETAPVCDLHVFLLLRSLDRCWCEFGNRGRISQRKDHLDAWFPIIPLTIPDSFKGRKYVQIVRRVAVESVF